MSRVISPWETSITMNVKLYGLYCLMAMATPYHALHAISAHDVAHSIKETKNNVDPRIVPAKIERLQRPMTTPYHALHAISALDVAHSIKKTENNVDPRIVPAKIERLQ